MRKTELSQAKQHRDCAPLPSWWKAGSFGAWSSISMWATTAEEMIGIHSVIWLPCDDRVPLVQWLRKAEAWIRHRKCDAAGPSEGRDLELEGDPGSRSATTVGRRRGFNLTSLACCTASRSRSASLPPRLSVFLSENGFMMS